MGGRPKSASRRAGAWAGAEPEWPLSGSVEIPERITGQVLIIKGHRHIGGDTGHNAALENVGTRVFGNHLGPRIGKAGGSPRRRLFHAPPERVIRILADGDGAVLGLGELVFTVRADVKARRGETVVNGFTA